MSQLNNQERMSFLNGVYTESTLGKGTKLWRFVSEMSDRYSLGTYWIDEPTMKEIMQTLHHHGDFSRKFKNEVIRNDLAIIEKWSRLKCRQQITLKKDVKVYRGIINRQLDLIGSPTESVTLFDRKVAMYLSENSKMRAGGYTQYYIPQFRGMSKREKENWVSFGHFASV